MLFGRKNDSIVNKLLDKTIDAMFDESNQSNNKEDEDEYKGTYSETVEIIMDSDMRGKHKTELVKMLPKNLDKETYKAISSTADYSLNSSRNRFETITILINK